MPKDEKNEGTKFKVTDRRLFTEEGEPRQDIERATESESRRPEASRETRAETPPRPSASTEESARQGQSRASEPGRTEPMSIDFSQFLFSMATSAFIHLGEVPDPMTGQQNEDLQAARQSIDILTILKEKTKGNLTFEEQRLLDQLLYELRMKFLSKSKVIRF
ncbi:MAG TPA: DUF1844 domain-containing protein [Acidobacteriota bacterium]|nr:DUF1844 domain-containing protein [Acidobacteriota bacterium]